MNAHHPDLGRLVRVRFDAPWDQWNLNQRPTYRVGRCGGFGDQGMNVQWLDGGQNWVDEDRVVFLVVHCKRDSYNEYVGRPSEWGNPFKLTNEGDRESVLAKYRAWLMKQTKLVERAKQQLKFQVLGCWCAPRACHGDVLAEIANGP